MFNHPTGASLGILWNVHLTVAFVEDIIFVNHNVLLKIGDKNCANPTPPCDSPSIPPQPGSPSAIFAMHNLV